MNPKFYALPQEKQWAILNAGFHVFSQNTYRGAVKAWIFTTSDFTPEGVDEARITGVNLVNGDELIRSLDLYYPGKYCL